MVDGTAGVNAERTLGPTAEPVPEQERIASIDVLRGVAVLGILAMNIAAFAMPSADYFDPRYEGNYEGVNRLVWIVNHFLFDQKMMSIFAMLFGAGIVLMSGRAERRSGASASLHYRRMGWLLVIGLIHAYFLWYGDILVWYALCGMIVYPLRKLRSRWLIPLGVAVTLVVVPINAGLGLLMSMSREEAQQAAQARAEGRKPTEWQTEMEHVWSDMKREFQSDDESRQNEERLYRGRYVDQLRHRAAQSLMMHTTTFGMWGIWRCAGLMLIGMGLFKLGFFDAKAAMRLRVAIMLVCYAVGLTLVAIGWRRMEAHAFDIVQLFQLDWNFNYVASVIVAIAHVCAIMLWCRSGVMTRAQRLLGNVGRSALSNYIFQTLLCTTIFYGYGFGLFGTLVRWQLVLIVLGVWALNITLSAWWMARYQFGPLEWIWRSLTYARVEPLRREMA